MMLVSRVFALLIAALVVAVPTVAFADPPDPTWIGGFWDDDDFDNAVLAITSASAIEVASRIDAGFPLWIPIARVASEKEECLRTPVCTVVSPRAPPVVSSAQA